MGDNWNVIFPDRASAPFIEARDAALLDCDEQYRAMLAANRAASLADLYSEEVWAAYWETVFNMLGFADCQAQVDAIAFAEKHLTNS